MSCLPPEQSDPAYEPDGRPPAPAHPRRSNVPLDPLAWKRAHADYVAGCSCGVIAERYGVDERTVRRHVRAESWRHDRPEHLRGLRLKPPEPDIAPEVAWEAGEPMTAEAQLNEDPDLRLFMAAHNHEVSQLLMRPGPQRLSRFAFRRASEAAADGRPAEAGSWMRLVKDIARTEDHMLKSALPFGAAEYMRAGFAARLREHAGIEPQEDARDFEPIDNRTHWRGKAAYEAYQAAQAPKPEEGPESACPGGR